MKRCLVVAALSALALAGCGSDDEGEPAAGDVVAAPSSTAPVVPDIPECSAVFVDGQVVTAEAATTDQCMDQGKAWAVTSLDCTDGRALLHPATGWGYVGEPYHAQVKADGGIPDPVYNACMGG